MSRLRIPGTNVRGWRALLFAVVGLYVLLFIILNAHKIGINFVFFTLRTSQLFALILVTALGFGAGLFVGTRRGGNAVGSRSLGGAPDATAQPE